MITFAVAGVSAEGDDAAAAATEDPAEDVQSGQRLDVVHEGSPGQVRPHR